MEDSELNEITRVEYLESQEKCPKCRYPMPREGECLVCMNCENKIHRPIFFGKDISSTRPTYSDPEFKKRLAKEYAPEIKEWIINQWIINDSHGDEPDLTKIENDIIETWSPVQDGYEMANRLKDCGYWPDVELVEILDNIHGNSVLSKMEAEWVKKNGIKPEHSVGDMVAHKATRHGLIIGEIISIDTETAKYTLNHKELGHVKEGSGTYGFIINYDDVEKSENSND